MNNALSHPEKAVYSAFDVVQDKPLKFMLQEELNDCSDVGCSSKVPSASSAPPCTRFKRSSGRKLSRLQHACLAFQVNGMRLGATCFSHNDPSGDCLQEAKNFYYQTGLGSGTNGGCFPRRIPSDDPQLGTERQLRALFRMRPMNWFSTSGNTREFILTTR